MNCEQNCGGCGSGCGGTSEEKTQHEDDTGTVVICVQLIDNGSNDTEVIFVDMGKLCLENSTLGKRWYAELNKAIAGGNGYGEADDYLTTNMLSRVCVKLPCVVEFYVTMFVG